MVHVREPCLYPLTDYDTNIQFQYYFMRGVTPFPPDYEIGGYPRDMVTPRLCGGTRMQEAHVKYIGRNSYQAVEVQCDIHIWIKPDQIVNALI